MDRFARREEVLGVRVRGENELGSNDGTLGRLDGPGLGFGLLVQRVGGRGGSLSEGGDGCPGVDGKVGTGGGKGEGGKGGAELVAGKEETRRGELVRLSHMKETARTNERFRPA